MSRAPRPPSDHIEQEIVQAVRMPKYESWGGYKDMFALNVAGMYRHVQAHRRPN